MNSPTLIVISTPSWQSTLGGLYDC
jgi:hypothetical protein